MENGEPILLEVEEKGELPISAEEYDLLFSVSSLDDAVTEPRLLGELVDGDVSSLDHGAAEKEEQRQENGPKAKLDPDGQVSRKLAENGRNKASTLTELENLEADMLTIPHRDVECETYIKRVLPWRIRAARLNSLSFTVEDIDNLLKQFRSEFQTDFPFDEQVVPELTYLRELLFAYREWTSTHRLSLQLLTNSKSRRRTESSSALESPKRVAYQEFSEMVDVAKGRFQLFNTQETRTVLNTLQEVELVKEKADSIIDKLQKDWNVESERPKFKVLQHHYYMLQEFSVEVAAQVVVHPRVELIEELLETSKWRTLAVQRLITASSRTSFVDSQCDPEFVPASQHDLQDLVKLYDDAVHVAKIPVDASGSCQEENILMNRLSRLVAVAKCEQKLFRETLSAVQFSSGQLVEDVKSNLQTLQAAVNNTAALLSESDHDIPTSELTQYLGVWFPERDVVDDAVELCLWYIANKQKITELNMEVETRTQSLPPLHITTPAADSDCVQLEALLNRANALITCARESGGIFQAKRQSEGDEKEKKNKKNAELASALALVTCADELFQDLLESRDKLESKYQERREDWKRSLIGLFVEVDWEGVWYLAMIAAYDNFDNVHVFLYDNKEIEDVIFEPDGTARSPDNDEIAWRATKNRFQPSKRDLARARGEASGEKDEKGASNKKRNDAFAKSVVGKFIKVEWEKGEYFVAKVINYDASRNLHTVLYRTGRAEEQILLKIDGTAQSETGEEHFRWVNTKEAFDADIESDDGDSDVSDYDTDESETSDADYKSKRPSSKVAAKEKTDGGRNKPHKTSKKSKLASQQGPVAKNGSRRVVKRAKDSSKWKEKQAKREAKLAARELERKKAKELWRAKREQALSLFSKLFASHLGKKDNNNNNNQNNPSAPEDSYVTLVRDLVVEISRQVGQAGFAEKVRTLYANLRKNATLRSKFVSGDISASELCSMSTDLLASGDFQRKMKKEVQSIVKSNVVHTTGGNPDSKRSSKSSTSSTNANTTTTTSESGVSSSVSPTSSAPPGTQGSTTTNTEEKKPHMIDIMLEQQKEKAAKEAAALLGVSLQQGESFKPPTELPSLQSLVSFDAIDPEEDAQDEAEDNDEDTAVKKPSSGKRKHHDVDHKKEHKKKKTKTTGDVSQHAQWTGFLKDGSGQIPVCLELLETPGTVLFGPALRDGDKLLPSCVLGLVGALKSALKVAGRARIEKAVPYINELVDKCDRQLVVTGILEAPQSPTGHMLATWLEGREREGRAGVVDHGKGGVMIYLIPKGLLPRFTALSHINPPSHSLGVAVVIVKPHGLDGSLLRALKQCKPLREDETLLNETSAPLPSPVHQQPPSFQPPLPPPGPPPFQYVPPPQVPGMRAHVNPWEVPRPPPYHPPPVPLPPPSQPPQQPAILRDKNALQSLLQSLQRQKARHATE